MEYVTLTRKEQTRVKLLNEVNESVLTAGEAAGLLGVSLRQARRLLAASPGCGYPTEGVAAMAHGNRGRQPAHRIDAATRQKVRALADGRYAGCNQRHLTDLSDGPVRGCGQRRRHSCGYQRAWQYRREHDRMNFVEKVPSPYAYIMHSVLIASAKHVPTNELDMQPYVNTRPGPVRQISCPDAKKDRRMLTRYRRQWDTSEELTMLESSSIASAPLKNGLYKPKITSCPYSSVRPHHVNAVNGTNTPHRLPRLAGFFYRFCE
jgi:plasmid stabilization system protein ParE